MGSDSLLWGEGLFLRPQHFQVIERQFHDKLSRSEHWATPFPYGLHTIVIDRDALANWRISLSECHLRFRDGTQLRCPQDAHLSPIEIPRDTFDTADSKVRVYVGLPELRRGFSNTSAESNVETRYVSFTEPVEDENATGNPQDLELRKLNPTILIGDEAARGFDAVPIMQLRLGRTAEAPPQIDTSYIPPVLVAEAWQQLERFIRMVYDRLSAEAERLSQQMIDRGIAFASGNRDDFEHILKLQSVNTALGELAYLPFTPGIHPFVVYRQLCKAAGSLAIFRKERRLAELPVYDHDNIAPCFAKLGKLLELDDADEAYERVPFASQGYQMTVRLNPDWLATTWSFYIGVQSKIKSRRVTELLSQQELGMKVGSSEKVDGIYDGGEAGVRIVPVGDPPRVFPQNDWHYFRVNREGMHWDDIEQSLNLGIRFNSLNVVKQIDGEDRIDVKDRESGSLVTMAFSLFAIQRSTTES
jgi:type VI secretion system protein ImpJ